MKNRNLILQKSMLVYSINKLKIEFAEQQLLYCDISEQKKLSEKSLIKIKNKIISYLDITTGTQNIDQLNNAFLNLAEAYDTEKRLVKNLEFYSEQLLQIAKKMEGLKQKVDSAKEQLREVLSKIQGNKQIENEIEREMEMLERLTTNRYSRYSVSSREDDSLIIKCSIH